MYQTTPLTTGVVVRIALVIPKYASLRILLSLFLVLAISQLSHQTRDANVMDG